MIWRIAFKELTYTLRDRSFLGLIAILLGLFITASLVSSKAHSRSASEMASLQDIVSRQWMEQPDRHPHRVAHYGYLVFRPRTGLGFFDFGLSDFTGNSIFLEAHVQNSANFSEARQDSSLLRFGTLTPSFVVQVLVPLLIIFLTGRSITRERESGTLAQILSLGLSWTTFLWGKVAGGMLVFLILLGPIVAAVTLIAAQMGTGLSGEALVRLCLLGCFYTLYLFAWAVLSVLVSARSTRSSHATVILLGLWICFITLLPKGLPSLGAHLYEAPTRPDFEHRIHLEIVSGGHGHNPGDAHFEAKKQELLERYGVDKVEDLPLNWRGIAMQAGEDASSEVYRRHYRQLQDVYRRQNQLSQWASVFDPYLAMKSLSSTLCGTDFDSSVSFEEQAESYRYDLVRKLNELHTHKIDYNDDKAQRVDAEHWAEFEAFEFKPATLDEDLARSRPILLALLFQIMTLLLLLWRSPVKVR